ncbi:MAG TPA: hypothetical protein VJ986_14780 [Gaiellaceae bacterium]|nr:hypothetical protein [Gaiellaceae bacterium]
MKRISGVTLAVVVLAAAGFAAASIASGAGLVGVLTGTTGTTGTTETATTTSTGTTASGRRVIVCHHTHSKKHPWVTIRVSWHAIHAVIKHGGYVGLCTGATTSQAKQKHGKHHEGDTSTNDSATTSSPQDGQGSSHEQGQSNGNGQSDANGQGHEKSGSSHHKGP